VELVLAAGLDQVLVAADAGGLHRLAGQLLQLVRDLNNGYANRLIKQTKNLDAE
jgi:hypothetical protein